MLSAATTRTGCEQQKRFVSIQNCNNSKVRLCLKEVLKKLTFANQCEKYKRAAIGRLWCHYVLAVEACCAVHGGVIIYCRAVPCIVVAVPCIVVAVPCIVPCIVVA